MILVLEKFFQDEMHGFLRWNFFSGARCMDSCVPIFFLRQDARILVLEFFF